MLINHEHQNLLNDISGEELGAVKQFEEKRWGSAPLCPYCGSASLSKRRKDLRFKCLTCKKSGSVTVNSMLHDTRLPMHVWLKAFTLTTDGGKVPTASHLQKDLNISYKSALRMHNKIHDLIGTDAAGILQSNLLETLLVNSMKQPVHQEEQMLA